LRAVTAEHQHETEPPMTEFSDLLRGMRRDGDAWTAPVSDDWLQGRTLFGGLSGALSLEAVAREFTDLPSLRSAQFALIPGTGLFCDTAS
jgi:hypothetical protein